MCSSRSKSAMAFPCSFTQSLLNGIPSPKKMSFLSLSILRHLSSTKLLPMFALVASRPHSSSLSSARIAMARQFRPWPSLQASSCTSPSTPSRRFAFVTSSIHWRLCMFITAANSCSKSASKEQKAATTCVHCFASPNIFANLVLAAARLLPLQLKRHRST